MPGDSGKNLRIHRIERGWTQGELAERAGVSVRAVRDVELGRRGRHRDETLNRLRYALGLTDATADEDIRGRELNVGLLGPLIVRFGKTPLAISSAAQRVLLGLLALRVGEDVFPEEIAETLWASPPAATWRNLIHVHINRLRSTLEPARDHRAPSQTVAYRNGAYTLTLPADQLDARSFNELVESARRAADEGDATEACQLYEQALVCWRGPVLAGAEDRVRRHPAAHFLQRRRLDAALAFADLAISVGEHGRAKRRLLELAEEEPLHEGLHAALMIALAGSGEQASALNIFTQMRQRLAEQLGVDPGAEIMDAHRHVLQASRSAPLVVTAPADVAPAAVPMQLPADVSPFAGRCEEIRTLDGGNPASAWVISGTAGVGKSALAAHWAHRTAYRFPDGQLWANLHGFDAQRPPAQPIDVLRHFLRALGVAPGSVPSELDEAAALYRSLLSGRAVLIVLDNARTAEQVRPLLPGSAGCATIVTSRSRLAGLMATHGAQLIDLQTLAPRQAVELLEDLIGKRAADQTPVVELARRCAYLPLALRVAAANILCNPSLTVAGYTAGLAEGQTLSALTTGNDERSAVQSAITVSYRDLTVAARGLFRLLYLFPGPDFCLPAASALIGATAQETARLLNELSDAHLISEHRPGRFTMHDLLRDHSIAQAKAEEAQDGLISAIRRLVDFYVRTLHDAYGFFHQRRTEVERDIVYPPADPLSFADRDAALAWHDDERENLVGVTLLARVHHWREATWQLADSLFAYFITRRLWPEWLSVLQAGLAAAEELSHVEAMARMHNAMGVVFKQTGQYGPARGHYSKALELAAQMGNRRLVAAFHVNLGGLLVNEGDPEAAIRHLQEALADVDYGTVPEFATVTYINYGCALIGLNRLEEATAALVTAEQFAARAGDLLNATHAYHNLAEIALQRDDFATALDHAERGYELAVQIGDPLRQAIALDMIASATVVDDLEEATSLWRRALETYRDVGHRLMFSLDRWLDELDSIPAEDLRSRDGRRRLQARHMV